MKLINFLNKFIPKKYQHNKIDIIMKGENEPELINLNDMLANPYQPIRKYQFIIDFENNVIDSFVVKSFNFEGATNNFYLQVYVPIEKKYEYQNVKNITIKWLDPVGVVVTKHEFKLAFEKLWYDADYAESKPLIIHLKYKVENFKL
jgi:hypothetical protein